MVRGKKNLPKKNPEQKTAKKIGKNSNRHIVIPSELKKNSPPVTLSLDTILTKSDIDRLLRILSSPDKESDD
ncbi:MAG: hypothetical protein HQL68_06760 [Magnetococcales bacterium]|nr:hypothetical protein [Magnetococcales bacterium]